MIKRLVGLGVITALALSAGPVQAQVKKTEILAAIKAAFTTWEGISCSNLKFNYAGPLTEALLLGVVANRFPDTKLIWDADKLKVTNLDDASKLIRREYRKGFAVEGL